MQLHQTTHKQSRASRRLPCLLEAVGAVHKAEHPSLPNTWFPDVTEGQKKHCLKSELITQVLIQN